MSPSGCGAGERARAGQVYNRFTPVLHLLHTDRRACAPPRSLKSGRTLTPNRAQMSDPVSADPGARERVSLLIYT